MAVRLQLIKKKYINPSTCSFSIMKKHLIRNYSSTSLILDVNMTEKLESSAGNLKGLKLFNLGEEKLQRRESFPETFNGMKSVLWKGDLGSFLGSQEERKHSVPEQ